MDLQKVHKLDELKIGNLKRGIRIAEKRHKQEGITEVVM